MLGHGWLLSWSDKQSKLNAARLYAGTLPDWIASSPTLQTANVSSNHLTGPLPPALVSQSLKSLDVSYNNLSGPLPTEVSLPSLQFLDVTGNINLTGPVPSSWSAQLHQSLKGTLRCCKHVITLASSTGYTAGYPTMQACCEDL